MLVKLIADSEGLLDKGDVKADAWPSCANVLTEPRDHKGLVGLDELEEHSRYVGNSN